MLCSIVVFKMFKHNNNTAQEYIERIIYSKGLIEINFAETKKNIPSRQCELIWKRGEVRWVFKVLRVRVWQLRVQLFKLIKMLRAKTAKKFSKVECVSTPELIVNISIQLC